jgi:hypothetical protein
MYGALSALPFVAGSFIWKFADILLPGDFSMMSYVVFVGTFTAALVLAITNVAEISSPKILKGKPLFNANGKSSSVRRVGGHVAPEY